MRPFSKDFLYRFFLDSISTILSNSFHKFTKTQNLPSLVYAPPTLLMSYSMSHSSSEKFPGIKMLGCLDLWQVHYYERLNEICFSCFFLFPTSVFKLFAVSKETNIFCINFYLSTALGTNHLMWAKPLHA